MSTLPRHCLVRFADYKQKDLAVNGIYVFCFSVDGRVAHHFVVVFLFLQESFHQLGACVDRHFSHRVFGKLLVGLLPDR